MPTVPRQLVMRQCGPMQRVAPSAPREPVYALCQRRGYRYKAGGIMAVVHQPADLGEFRLFRASSKGASHNPARMKASKWLILYCVCVVGQQGRRVASIYGLKTQANRMNTVTQHRARLRLSIAGEFYRWMFDAVIKVRAGKVDWPDYIFVPMSKLLEICKYLKDEDIAGVMMTDRRVFSDISSAGLTFSIWRMTQGIYQFDETLYSELIRTENSGTLPADVLIRLPEWCVYIETPGLSIDGAWARIDIGPDDEVLLVLAQDVDSDDCFIPLTYYITIGSGTINQNIQATATEWMVRRGKSEQEKDKHIASLKEWIHPVVNLLLYLCAGADYANAVAPHNPLPVKTKRGPRLFAPQKETTWNVGTRMGAALRAAYAARAHSGGSGGEQYHVRPHIRRAHWHSFRSGPRFTPDGEPIPTADRQLNLRWLPPIPVNIEDIEGLPSVIKPVKMTV